MVRSFGPQKIELAPARKHKRLRLLAHGLRGRPKAAPSIAAWRCGRRRWCARTRSASSDGCVRKRRAGDADQHVDRHRFRMRRQVRQRRDHADAVLARLAHADDAAAADVDAGGAHVVERFQAIFVGARGYDLAVEFRRGVEIVIVVVEAGGLELSAPCGAVSMPSVTQVSSPSALTPSTMAQT